jgi:EmrB/QacA subfamily drug resistance transporter
MIVSKCTPDFNGTATGKNMDDKHSSPSAILWVIAAVQFLTPFMFSAIGVALPAIGREFSSGAVELGLIETVYILAIALLLLPIGRYADIHGRKRIFLAGTVVITVATLALALAPTIEFLILFRFIQGIGAAMITSTSFAILTSVYPPHQRGKAMGIVVGSVYLGISAGPTLAGLMIDYIGWRYIFYFAVPIEMIILLFAILRLHGEWAGSPGERFDWFGSALYVTALFSLVFGTLQFRQFIFAQWLVPAGVLFFAVFIFYQKRSDSPILPIDRILTNRTFALSNLATWFNYAAFFGITFFFSIYLQIIRGLPAKTTGFILIVQPLLQAFFAPLAGRMADKYSPAPIATIGMALCTIGLLAASFIDKNASFILIYVVLVVAGLGFGLFSTPNTAAIMSSVDKRDYGMASSMIATMRTTGMLTAMTLITMLLAYFLGDQPINEQTGDGFMATMHTAMIIFTLLGIAGIFCSIGRSSAKKNG